ncbi:MAG: hypothetical protein H6581_06985 [Bacteroidia bacterium]|nr:hypothetical protein [Bacteroidia bacterium]
MKRLLAYLTFSLILLPGFGQVQTECAEAVTSAGSFALTVTHNGLIGNAFSGNYDINGWPSGEYPRNSGIEHVFDGGFWAGARINGVDTRVTSAAADAPGGYSPGAAGFEMYAPVGQCIEIRSSLFDHPNFDPEAVSHQDFVTYFADSGLKVPGTNTQIGIQSDPHVPLNLGVDFQAYNWNFAFADYFVIFNLHVTNIGPNSLNDLYLGYWADLVVRNTNLPSAQPVGVGSAFYNKGGNGYLDSLYLAYEFDAAGEPEFTRSYGGIMFLGAENNVKFFHPRVDTSFKCNYNTWQFQNSTSPIYFSPNDDNERYSKMVLGLNQNAGWESQIRAQIRTPNNRTNLISVGPFGNLLPGQSIDIAFAVICAKMSDDGNPAGADTDEQRALLAKNASWAVTAYNGEDTNGNGVLDPGEDRDGDGKIDRYILPAPPDIPQTKIVPTDHSIEVYWGKNAEKTIDPISKKQDFEGYRIYKTQVGYDVKSNASIAEKLKLVAEYDSLGDKIFLETGFDKIRLKTPVKFEGDTTQYWYKYEFSGITNGWQHAVAVTAFDQGDPENNLGSLESSNLANLKLAFPGKSGNDGFANGEPFVYPNPYYAGASWEGSSTLEEDRKIIFANLPSQCEVRIYTVAGDFVDMFEHNQDYNGDDIRWFDTYSNPDQTTFSGGEHAWDLLSKDNQIIARGIYLFSVKDLSTGKLFQGKFVVIK